MDWQQTLVDMGGAGAVVLLLLAPLRSPKVRSAVSRLFTETTEIQNSLTSLRSVVDAQGESIEWLRNELDHTRTELDQAREQLRQTESLRQENVLLRNRITELEATVERLEDQLRTRRRARKEVAS